MKKKLRHPKANSRDHVEVSTKQESVRLDLPSRSISASGLLRRHWLKLTILAIALWYVGTSFYHVGKAEKHGFIDHRSVTSYLAFEIAYDLQDFVQFIPHMLKSDEASDTPKTLKIAFARPRLYNHTTLDERPLTVMEQRFYQYQKAYVMDQIGFRGTEFGQRTAHRQFLTLTYGTLHDAQQLLSAEQNRQIGTLPEDEQAQWLALEAARYLMEKQIAHHHADLHIPSSKYYYTEVINLD
jgi:hypothetical protein